MTDWPTLQPLFRDAVLAERAAGRSTEEIAAEIHVGRTTVFRMLAADGIPRPAIQDQVERFVESRSERSKDGDQQELEPQ